MHPTSSSAKSQPHVIIAPPSPPCSPSALSPDLTGYHRAPNYRHPNPHNGRPRPPVRHLRFKPAHPAQPKHPSPTPNPHRTQHWMMLKLDEDLFDPHADDALSDSASSDDATCVKPRTRAPQPSTSQRVYPASFPLSTTTLRHSAPPTAPVTIPQRKRPHVTSRRNKIGTYHGQTTAYRARMQPPPSNSYNESYSYSSDSELDDR